MKIKQDPITGLWCREMDGHVYSSGYLADPEYVNNLKKEME